MDAVLMSKLTKTNSAAENLNSAISDAMATLSGLSLNAVKRVQSGRAATNRTSTSSHATSVSVTLPYAVVPEKCIVIIQSAASMYVGANDDDHMMADVAWYVLDDTEISFYTSDMNYEQIKSHNTTIYWSIIEFL